MENKNQSPALDDVLARCRDSILRVRLEMPELDELTGISLSPKVEAPKPPRDVARNLWPTPWILALAIACAGLALILWRIGAF